MEYHVVGGDREGPIQLFLTALNAFERGGRKERLEG